MKKFYTILCLTIASLTQLLAQAPQGFNYQATVRNNTGDLIVNTNVYFKFNVMQGSQTSLPVFTEIHYVPTDDLGQVNLVIGQGTATTGAFSSIDWSLGSYYLGIELDTGNGYVAMGTTQLLSVPYALYAENSGNSTPTTPNLEAVLAENNSANNQQIKDLQDPTEAQDAVTKAYVDTEVLNNVQSIEQVLTQGNDANGIQLKGIADPTDAQDAVTKAYIDALITNLQSQIDELDSNISSGSVTDQDGNTYDYFTYGDQVWTVDNAEMVTYRDGTPIPQVTDATEWANLTTGAWCYYNNDPTKPRLYNWYAVAGIHDNDENTPNKQFAPEGWHVPSDAEWTTLENYLIANGYNYDGTTTENKIAKSMASTTGWNSATNTGAVGNDQSLNNSSSFKVFPQGFCAYDGSFNYEGYSVYFWSSTEYGTSSAWYRFLYSNGSDLARNYASYGQSGLSVRFVKDGEIDPNDIDNDNDGYSENQGDCDDNNVQINPDVAEIEDGIDNNCDGEVDEGFNEELTFPVITTNELIEIFSNHAFSGGNITSDGGAEVTERGVVWGTSPNPTINLETKTQNGGGTGNFSSYVYGLSLGVEYYLRAYATNSVGTAYGDEIVFETSYAIGQQGPAGGLIFYDKGFYSDGWRYLEANQTDFSFGGVVWWNGNWNYQNEIGISPNSNLGDGKANTLLIIEANNNLNNAAKVCNDFVYNGYSDWYLPSIGELELMCQNLYSEGIGNFADSFYWSSTDTNKIHNAHWIQFSSSPSNCVVRTDMGRNMENLVRPIRQF